MSEFFPKDVVTIPSSSQIIFKSSTADSASSTWIILQHGSSALNFYTSGDVDNIFSVLTSGNFGIGTNNPLTQLHVTGSISSGTITSSGSGYFDGRIGIGTRTPKARLHIHSNDPGDGTFLRAGILLSNTGSAANAGETAISFQNDNLTSGGNYWLVGLNQGSQFDIAYGQNFTLANTKMRINVDGSVGIGVDAANPVAHLHVTGSISAQSITAGSSISSQNIFSQSLTTNTISAQSISSIEIINKGQDNLSGLNYFITNKNNTNILGEFALRSNSAEAGTFYAGKIKKNLFKNSEAISAWGTSPRYNITDNSWIFAPNNVASATIVAYTGTTASNATLLDGTYITYPSTTGRNFALSFWISGDTTWMTSIRLVSRPSFTTIVSVPRLNYSTWTKIALIGNTTAAGASADNIISMNARADALTGTFYLFGMQLEENDTVTNYQKTDNTIYLGSDSAYLQGMWATSGGFGQTVQNAAIKLSTSGLYIGTNESIGNRLNITVSGLSAWQGSTSILGYNTTDGKLNLSANVISAGIASVNLLRANRNSGIIFYEDGFGDRASILSESSTNALLFKISSSNEVVRMTSSGIGIGTTNPLAQLHVTGSISSQSITADSLSAQNITTLGSMSAATISAGKFVVDSGAANSLGNAGVLVGVNSNSLCGTGLFKTSIYTNNSSLTIGTTDTGNFYPSGNGPWVDFSVDGTLSLSIKPSALTTNRYFASTSALSGDSISSNTLSARNSKFLSITSNTISAENVVAKNISRSIFNSSSYTTTLNGNASESQFMNSVSSTPTTAIWTYFPYLKGDKYLNIYMIHQTNSINHDSSPTITAYLSSATSIGSVDTLRNLMKAPIGTSLLNGWTMSVTSMNIENIVTSLSSGSFLAVQVVIRAGTDGLGGGSLPLTAKRISIDVSSAT